MRTMFAALLAMIAATAGIAPHRRALEQDAALRGSLAWVLLPGITSAAVALQLPEERRPPECTWDTAAHIAAAMQSMSPFEEALRAACRGNASSSNDRIASAAGKLLQAAALLMQHVPDTRPQADAERLAILLGSATQLQDSCMRQQTALGRPAVMPQQRRPARLLLAVIPKLVLLLQAAAGWQPSDQPSDQLAACTKALRGHHRCGVGAGPDYLAAQPQRRQLLQQHARQHVGTSRQQPSRPAGLV